MRSCHLKGCLGPILAGAVISVLSAQGWAQSKADIYSQMLALADQIQQIKSGRQNVPQGTLDTLTAEYAVLSQSLGGDDPGNLGIGGTGSAASNHSVRLPVPPPPGSVSSTASFLNNTPVAIPAGPAVVTSTLAVSGVDPYLWDLNLTTFLTHTFAADLDITLMSPAGTVVTLTTDNGAGNDNVFNGTLWDDSANPGGQVPYTTNNGLVTDQAYVNLNTASPLVPEEALAAFIGEDPNGTWTVTISDDLAVDAGSLDSWQLDFILLAQAPAAVQANFANNTPVAIPAGPAVVTSTLDVAGTDTYLCDVNLTTALTHTFAADLDITLMSPAGTVVTLTTDNGAGNDNVFNGTLWDDSANPGGQVPYTTNNGLVTDQAYANLTTASPLVPEEALAAFIGEDPNGTWTVTISDDLAGDPGSLNSWSLDLTTCVGSSADLSVTKTDGVASVISGGSTTYTIVASNAGPADAPSVTVTDSFPAGLSCNWTCVGAGGGSCAAGPVAGDIADNANLPAGASVTYTASCTLAANMIGSLSNTATVSSSVSDPNPANNSATDTDTIIAGAGVSGSKTASDPFIEGGSASYQIVLTNAGPGPQADNPGDEFVDVLPAGLTLVAANASSGTIGTAGNTVTWNGALGAGASVTISINASVNDNTQGQTLSNQGTINFDSDGDSSNDSVALTDDPSLPGAADATDRVVQRVTPVPAISLLGLLLLGLALAGVSWRRFPGSRC